MGYEVVSCEKDGGAPRLSAFQQSISDQIEVRGNQNTPNPYSPNENRGDIGVIYRADGRLDFEALWQVHRLQIDDVGVIYAHCPPVVDRPDPILDSLLSSSSEQPLEPRSIFYVHEFDSSGLAASTQFAEQEAGIAKTRSGSYIGFAYRELGRLLSKSETDDLYKAIEDPITNLVALRGLARLTKEDEKAVQQAHAEHDHREAEYRDTLESYDQMSKAAEAETRNIFIGGAPLQ